MINTIQCRFIFTFAGVPTTTIIIAAVCGGVGGIVVPLLVVVLVLIIMKRRANTLERLAKAVGRWISVDSPVCMLQRSSN